jgi:hypothetical protein
MKNKEHKTEKKKKEKKSMKVWLGGSIGQIIINSWLLCGSLLVILGIKQ